MFLDYITSELGTHKDIGHELRFCCPFCGEDDYKFYVKVSGDKTEGLWHCKKCNEKGNPVTFVMKYLNINFKDALDILEVYDYEIDENSLSSRDVGVTEEEFLLILLKKSSEPEEVEISEEVVLTPPRLPTNFKRLADNMNNPEALPFLNYAHSRGITLDQLFLHNIGYVIEGQVEKVDGNMMTLRNHLVFLTHGNDGQYQYWNTRAITPMGIKAFNAPSKQDEYSKRTTVFNLNIAKNTPYVIVHEGVIDALTMGESGVATFGKQITREQIDLLLNNVREDQPIYLFLDTEAYEVTTKIASSLYEKHKETYIVIHGDEDANDMGYEKSWDCLRNNSVRANEEGISIFLVSCIQ
ncbi:DNA primase/helicase [Listeria phage LMTA-57]|uniref:DNA primase/helicase n=3 Tax=Pecentumvirus TaxID=1857844 RepID=A0A060ALZ0_9CAUD|nr:DNA primase/helicase [Listeria phage LMSP-25]YP_009616243.1 DNA primase/helicase [Listeria phage LMTA-34]YP_009793402.1 DNA primase/helicase [Listeria phage LMTA-57]AIA64483.1 DNA primase/helicase [Listeria phage LMSP-25]AID17041.1 DNA primase/helicase [Listeria phage LMTA-34]AID17553.1 DNA primase/helicase [Listeria phage LMTA-57]